MSHPPPGSSPEPDVYNIQLESLRDGCIESVSVYSGYAEVTRSFIVNMKPGQNRINIDDLPTTLDDNSIRIEGQGFATIHDVAVSRMASPTQPEAMSSPELKLLLSKKGCMVKELKRSNKALSFVDNYVSSMDPHNIHISSIGDALKDYNAVGDKLDSQTLQLEEDLALIEQQILYEQTKLSTKQLNSKLAKRLNIAVVADVEQQVHMSIIYTVTGANWTAAYDIRVDLEADGNPVALTYQAGISQHTGEDWKDVSLTLETSAPTFGVVLPNLEPWALSVHKPPPPQKPTKARPGHASATPVSHSSDTGDGPFSGADAAIMADAFRRALRKPDFDSNEAVVEHRSLAVASKGNVNATYQIPGRISIPSDGVAHNVNIVRLSLDAAMSWVAVPKMDTRVHLKASIKNTSEYTFITGPASVFVDGSFISKSKVPLVSPDERFECALGLDPSIRLTYHPPLRKSSQSGFYGKMVNRSFEQRVSICNNKNVSINDLQIIDHIPVSEDTMITVKLVTPALSLPTEGTSGAPVGPPPSVQVQPGVTAQWYDEDPHNSDPKAAGIGLGKDGMISWACSIPPHGTVHLGLQWEVTAPAQVEINGM